MTRKVLSVSMLGRRLGGGIVLSGASFSLEEGRIAAVLGPSGAGKTTLLRLVAGLEVPDEGEVRLDGRLVSRSGAVLVPPRERGLGYAPQGHSLWPHLDAFENTAFPLRTRNVSEAEISRRVGETLESLGIGSLVRRRPAELSGGEQQRVALARALIHHPRLVLLDEPLTGLDAPARDEARRVVSAALRRAGAAALYVTHDHDDALTVADRLILLFEGKVVQDGPAEEVWSRPTTAAGARLLGATSEVPGMCRAGRAELSGGVHEPLTSGHRDGSRLRALFRPEDMELTDAVPAWTGVVRACVPRGGYYLLEVAAEEMVLTVRSAETVATGARVRVRARPGRAKIYDA